MSHNHNHSCVCTHENVAYCKHCRTVYCKSCNQEWVAKHAASYINYPNYPSWSWTNQTLGNLSKVAQTGSEVPLTNSASCAHSN